MVDLNKLVDELSKLNVIEASELAKLLEEKWGVTAAAPVAVAAVAATSGSEGDTAAEQTEFEVILTDAGAGKINVIKEVKALLGLGLKEAKDLVDGAPKSLKSGIKKQEAEEIKAKIEAAGAKVEIK